MTTASSLKVAASWYEPTSGYTCGQHPVGNCDRNTYSSPRRNDSRWRSSPPAPITPARKRSCEVVAPLSKVPTQLQLPSLAQLSPGRRGRVSSIRLDHPPAGVWKEMMDSAMRRASSPANHSGVMRGSTEKPSARGAGVALSSPAARSSAARASRSACAWRREAAR